MMIPLCACPACQGAIGCPIFAADIADVAVIAVLTQHFDFLWRRHRPDTPELMAAAALVEDVEATSDISVGQDRSLPIDQSELG